MEKDSEEAKWQRKERLTFTLFSPSAAAASSAIFQVDGFAIASEIGVVRCLKSMEILLVPFYLCCEFFLTKIITGALNTVVTNYIWSAISNMRKRKLWSGRFQATENSELG